VKGRLLVAAFLPGLPQVVAGRRLGGTVALLGWCGAMAILVTQAEAVSRGLAGDVGAKFSSWSVVVIAGAAWYWSVQELSRESGPPPGALRSFGARREAVLGALILLGWVVLALWAPFLAPHGPETQLGLVGARLLPPGGAALLGTDDVSRDVLSRLLWAARTSLGVAAWVVGISTVVGIGVGTAAGLVGGWVDGLLMRAADTFMAVPRIVLLIAVLAALGSSLPSLVLVLGLTLWPPTARMVRAELLSLKERPFVLAARGLGLRRRRIVLVHLLPHALPPALVTAALSVGQVILLEAGLSFLGLGPALSWGAMVADGRDHLATAWWVATLPGLAIASVTLGANLAGEGLRALLEGR
jgi:peptide/nickel transport system permease protein